jgi:sialidase-1
VNNDSDHYYHMRDGLRNCRGKFTREKAGRVAFLGGSITRMPGWSDLTTTLLRERFPDCDLDFVNAAIGGTNSTCGVFRFDSEVLHRGPVDMLFLEFAVNDADAASVDNQRLQAMEGIIRKARRSNPAMDILVLYFVDQSKVDRYHEDKEPEEITDHEAVMRHYRVPAINLAQEMTRRLDAGEFAWETFAGDTCHPNPFGHEQYLGCIRHFLNEAWENDIPETVASYTMPIPLFADNLEHAKLVGTDCAEDVQGWEMVTGWTPDKVCNFEGPVNVLAAVTPGAELSLSFTGSTVAANAFAGMDAGVLLVEVDGAAPREVDMYDYYSEFFHRPVFRVLANGLAAGDHRVRIRMAERNNPKSEGNAARVLQFGIA